MADNIINIGSEFDASAIKSGAEASKQAVGGIKIAFDLLGVTINDSVSEWLATLPGVGAAFEAAFPVLAVISFVQAISSLNDKLEQHHEAMRRAADEIVNVGLSFHDQAESAHIADLRLQDQIATLEHKPAQNGIAIAAEEGKQALNQLIGEFQNAIKKENELLAEQKQSFLERLLLGDTGINPIILKVKEFEDQIKALSTKYRLAQAEGNKEDASKYKSQLDAQLAQYKDYLKGQIAANETALQDRVTKLHRETGQIFDEYTKRFTAAQRAAAAQAYQKNEVATVKDLNEEYGKTNQLLRVLQLTVTDFSNREQEIARNAKPLVDKQSIVDVTRLAQAHGKLADAVKAVSKAASGAVIDWHEVVQQADKADEKARDLAANTERIDQLTRDIKSEQLQHGNSLAVALGYITEQEAAQRNLKQLEKDKSDAVTEINSRLTAQIDIVKKLSEATMGGLLGSPQQKAAFQKAVDDYQKLKIQQLEIERKYDNQIAAEQIKLANTASARLRKQLQDWLQLNMQLERSFMDSLNKMNSALASFIVEGKANWKQLVAGMLEGIIQIMLQWIEAWLIMKLIGKDGTDRQVHDKVKGNLAIINSDAFTAAAEAATANAAFGPAAMAQAAAIAGGIVGAFAVGASAVAKFEKGGVVPATGLALVHEGERILPRSMSGDGRGLSSGSQFVFAPTIHALDAEGVDRVLTRHQRVFENRVDKVLKKKGFYVK